MSGHGLVKMSTRPDLTHSKSISRTRDSWIVRAASRFTTVSPDRATVYAFDLEGRPISWFRAGTTYKRSLASEVHVRRSGNHGRKRELLSGDDARSEFGRLLDDVSGAPRDSLSARARVRIREILEWSPSRLLHERERFRDAYDPVAILPPDQYMSVVLQASIGCSWNRCTFCGLYRDGTFRVCTEQEFERHVVAVRRLLGRGAASRWGVFLADGNALMLSNPRLLRMIELGRRAFPGRPVSGFVDVCGGGRKSAREWAELKEAGVERVAVGVETGHDPLLAWLNKPGGARRTLEFVAMLTEAKLAVSVIVMAGVGGDRFAESHQRDTRALLAALPLSPGDIVYIAPFVEQPGSEYARCAGRDGVGRLGREDLETQASALRAVVRDRHPGVRVASYDIREFVY
jgi:radical SAM superfamily enzyme YgiQ (UPF0313 family)